MSGRRDFVPLGAGGRYLLDRHGVAYRVDDGPPRPLVPIPLVNAARHARADFRFDARDIRELPAMGLHDLPPKEAAPLVLVEDGVPVVEWVVTPPADAEAWWCGQTVPAVGDTATGWYALEMGDGSTQIIHGPSVAAHLFRLSR